MRSTSRWKASIAACMVALMLTGAVGSSGCGNTVAGGEEGTCGSGSKVACSDKPQDGDPCDESAGAEDCWYEGDDYAGCKATCVAGCWSVACDCEIWDDYGECFTCKPPCPDEVPREGEACEMYPICSYYLCTYPGPDPQCANPAPEILAECVRGTWSLDSCLP